jgi:predicted AAA+ superfamily ATPase
MIPRRLLSVITAALDEVPAMALLGPRQAGKTTLALEVAATRPSLYLDLESEADRAKLAEPELYLAQHADKLVILDEIQRAPQLFQSLRGLIDRGRREGHGKGRFLVLGSASIDLLKQSSESLAGRIRYLELSPLDASEVGRERLDALWLRGGFPESLLAESDAVSLRWRRDFIRTYLERDIPQLGPRIPAETLGGCGPCWRMAKGGSSTPRRSPARSPWTARRSPATSTCWWICCWCDGSRPGMATCANAW